MRGKLPKQGGYYINNLAEALGSLWPWPLVGRILGWIRRPFKYFGPLAAWAQAFWILWEATSRPIVPRPLSPGPHLKTVLGLLGLVVMVKTALWLERESSIFKLRCAA